MASVIPAPDLPERVVQGRQQVVEPSTAVGSARIIGGSAVLTDGSEGGQPFPAYVQLRVNEKPIFGSARSWFTCGGCIVHAWRSSPTRLAGFWVATASHCLDTSRVYEVNVWAGGRPAGSLVEQRVSFTGGQANNAPGWRLYGPGGIRIYRHPLFDEHQLLPDVALIRVLLPKGEDLPGSLIDASTGSVAWSRIPILARSETYANRAATILGFGKTSADSPSASTTLQQAAAWVEPSSFSWSTSRTDRLFYHWVVGESTLQGGALASTCSGDSGGPLLTRGGPEGIPPTLMGVLCCGWCRSDIDMRQYPSYYARLQPFLDAPSAAYSVGLSADSVWRQGMHGIIRDNSPVLLRTNELSPSGDASAQWSDGNEWIEAEGSAAGSLAQVLVVVFGVLALALVAYAIASLVGRAVMPKDKSKGKAGKREPNGEPKGASKRP
jgi:hypothetical protein